MAALFVLREQPRLPATRASQAKWSANSNVELFGGGSAVVAPKAYETTVPTTADAIAGASEDDDHHSDGKDLDRASTRPGFAKASPVLKAEILRLEAELDGMSFEQQRLGGNKQKLYGIDTVLRALARADNETERNERLKAVLMGRTDPAMCGDMLLRMLELYSLAEGDAEKALWREHVSAVLSSPEPAARNAADAVRKAVKAS